MSILDDIPPTTMRRILGAAFEAGAEAKLREIEAQVIVLLAVMARKG